VTWSIDTQSNAGLCSVNASAPQTLSCGPTDLAAGGSFSVHITATTSKTECTSYDNTATVTTTNDGSGSAEALITCHPAHVMITKTADAATVTAGNNIGFTLTVTNSGTGVAHGVVVTDTLPTNPGTSWTVNGGTAAGTCSIAAGVLTCTIGDLAVSASATVHITSPTTTATCGTVNNTGTVTSSNDGGNSSTASVTVTCPVSSQITPTGTTCQQFSSGTAQTLGTLNYNTKVTGGKTLVNSATPGVFFYYVKVTAPAASFTVDVTQSNTSTNNFPNISTNGLMLYDASCNSLKSFTTTGSTSSNSLFNITGATPGATYFLSVKYQPSNLKGSPVPVPTNITYNYAAKFNSPVPGPVPNSGQSIGLVKN
jgi:uncharacterized repeat protein (TIGR01451 family)